MTAETSKPSCKAAESGVLCFDGQIITYTSQHYASFSLPLTDVAVIGEFSTGNNSPAPNDWFLVFVRRGGHGFFEASMDAEHSSEVCKLLGEALRFELLTELAFSTDFSSRVLWPAPLAGKPLYTFTDELAEAVGFWHRLRLRLRLFKRVIHRLSPDVVHHLTTVT
jgi:hypothetical protein